MFGINDKILHFGVGFVIAITIALLINPLVGVAVGAAVGVGKEVRDLYKYGGFDFFDMFATIAGSVIGVMVLHLFQTFVL